MTPIITCVALFLLGTATILSVGGQQSLQGLDDDGPLFPVSIIHINDFHARFEETNERATACKPLEGQTCIGGYARAVTMVKTLMEYRNETNPIYLNAGDNFQGTLWYNVGRWNVTSQFLNMLNADAITLGNHEFDNLIEGVVPFLDSLESPVIVSNIDDTLEPTMQGKYKKSIIIDRYERKIGVIGVILSTTDEIASTGKLKFLDESEALRAEAAELKKQGVNIIIALSHCGLDVDYKIARNVGPDIDVIVGGHSHTFMFTGENPPGPDYARDEYPAVVTQASGHRVLIVQASAYAKYIGDLTVYFDVEGNVVRWDGFPIFLDKDVKQDEEVMRAMIPWREVIDAEGLRKIGVTKVPLQKSPCNTGECNIGNFIADGYVHQFVPMAGVGEWTYASIALVAVGGIRTTLNKGDLTYGDLVTTQPFENTIDAFDIRGDHLLETLEYSVTKSWDENFFNGAHMLQVSGLQVVYNVTNPIGQRVVSVMALCHKCEVPVYSPLKPQQTYRILVASFMSDGGDGFDMIAKYGRNKVVGPTDLVALTDFVERMTPIFYGETKRITVLT